MSIFGYVLIAVVLGGLAYNFWRSHQIKAKGIEADGMITRVEETDSTDSDGDITTSYHYYVRYTDQDGVGREALLTNTYTKRDLVPGDRVKIKYLPGKKTVAVLALLLILCLQAVCCCAETSEAFTSFSIEALLAANSPEAVMSRHESFSITVKQPYARDFSHYYDRETFFEALPDQLLMIGDGEAWLDLNPGGEEKKPAIVFFAMPDADRDAQIASFTPQILDASTKGEEVQSVTENDDGTLTVVTWLSADRLAARIERDPEIFPDEFLGNIAETVYTLDAGTLEVLSLVDSVLVGDEKIMYTDETVQYDVSRPEGVDRILALRNEFGTAEEGHMRTLTVIYDAGTEAEEIYTLNIHESVLVSLYLKDGYSEERRESSEGSGLQNFTVWAVPTATDTSR